MQKLLVVLAGAAVLAWTAPVGAQGTGSKPTDSGKASSGGQDMQQRGGASAATGPKVLASSFTAQVTGEVSKVDTQSGKLTLKTPDGPLTVTFPPVAVQHVKQGDKVTVALGLVESNPSASPGSGSTGAGSGAGSSGSSTKK